MKVFLSIVSALMVLLGTGWLLFPETMLGLWSVKTDATGVYVARRYGGLLFGYAAILWLGRASGPSAITGAIGRGAWGAVVMEAVLTAGFLYYFLAERAQTQANAAS